MKKKVKFFDKIKSIITKIKAWLESKSLFILIRDTLASFGKHRVMKMSAALSYYTFFSLPAMLVIIIGLCGIFFGEEIVKGKVFGIMNDYVGDKTAYQLQAMLQQISLRGTSVWAAVIGFITLLFGATGIFGEIQDSLNYMWGLKAKPRKNWIKLLMNRLMSFSMLLILAFILLVSLVLTSTIEFLIDRLTRNFSPTVIDIFRYLNNVVILLAVSTLFMFLFKILADGKVHWKDALIGALVTGVLFMFGKYLISFYLSQNSNLASYGGTASLAVLLVWVYYSSVIMYLGAEFTQVFAAFKGRKIEPKIFAVSVEVKEKEKKSGKVVKKTG